MSALRLLAKDARLLTRTPALLAVLVGYPILVAILVALSLQSEERRPEIALVNLEDSERTVVVGGERVGVEDYVERISEEVAIRRLDADAARRALDDGRVAAVLTIPDGFVDSLLFGARPPVVELQTSRRSALRSEAITRRIESAVFRLNQRLATDYIEQLLRLAEIVVEGGTVTVFGITGDVFGVKRSRELIAEVQRRLVARGETDIAERLEDLDDFVDDTEDSLALAADAASAIRSPIRLEIVEGPGGREPLSSFGMAGALLISIGLVGVLLAAAAVSAEREDNTLARLRRGLATPQAIVGEKMLFSALASFIVGTLLLVIVAVTTALVVGRWGWWILALLLAGLGFAGFGTLVGTLARETRTALLAGLMLTLPLLFVGLVPDSALADAISALVPFGPAFDVFQALLVEPEVPSGLALDLVHLAGLAAALGTAATAVLIRREAR